MTNSEEKSCLKRALEFTLSVDFKETTTTSPVTDLTMNLSGLMKESISSTPHKRLKKLADTPNSSRRSILGCLKLSKDSPSAADSPVLKERLLKDVRIDSSEHQRALRRNKSLPNHLECMNKENIPNIVEESTENKVYQDGDLHNFPERNLNSDSLSSGFEEFNQNTVEERQSSFAKPNILPHSMLYFIDFSTGMRSSLASTSSSELDQSIIRVSSSNTWCLPNFSTFKEKHCDDGLCDVFDSTENNENSLPDGMLELLTAPLIQTHKPESQQKGKKLTTRARIRRCLSMKMEENESRNEASKKMNTNCISPPIHPHFLSSSSHILPSCVSLPGLKMDSKSNNDKREKELVITSDTPLALIQEEMDFYKDLKSTFKRPEPPKGLGSPIQSKRRKSIPLCEPFIRKPVQRSCSETEATIIKALMKSDMNPNLIGDFSKPYALPLIEGKQRELKNISPDTLVKLLTGCYSDLISGYTIVDCRYPYEYEGGHVIGAKNIYTKPGIVQEFFSNVKKPSQKNCRHIIVFHCEFSSERGPALYKFLREMDRQANKECYPQLYHPEMYILDGGYKAFYEKHWEFCEPQQYKPMKHKDHKHDLYHFRAKSKSLNEDSKTKVFVSSSLIF
ncbi:uncharacterized protein LOC143253672 isoform X2 [Tachypleus tridentatus]|uniref:uncharacterized protein LOC143253672 isoform X2 n=1 Tax=Tachypleus tridentatus TaxID=6853 RepID=UPI003FD3CACA